MQKLTGAIDTDSLVGLIETTPFFASKNVLLLQDTSLFKENKNEEDKKTGQDKKQELVSTMQTISLEFFDREFDKLALFTQERRITKALLTKVFAGLLCSFLRWY